MKLKKLITFLVLAATTFSMSVVYAGADRWESAYDSNIYPTPPDNPNHTGCRATQVAGGWRCSNGKPDNGTSQFSCTEGVNGMGACGFVFADNARKCIQSDDPSVFYRSCKCSFREDAPVFVSGLCVNTRPDTFLEPIAVAVQVEV